MRSSRRAFTLLETVGVLAIMALLAGASAFILTSSRGKADLHDAIEQFAQADLSTRTIARSSYASARLIIRPAAGRVIRTGDGSIATDLVTLPSNISVDRVRVADSSNSPGEVAVDFTDRGLSPTYAVRLSQTAGAHQWVVFAGLTGQMSKVSDEDLESIFEQATPPRTDAH